VAPAAVLLTLSLILGLWIPASFRSTLDEAAGGFRAAAPSVTTVAAAEEQPLR
jgi:hypothetical protein